MAKNKTAETKNSVVAYINSVENEQQRIDSFRLAEMMQAISGSDAKIWGTSIIGFGSYHYKYASGHEGDAPLIGFSPRKGATSLYIYADTEESRKLLKNLGKYKMGKACIYIKKLADIDEPTFYQIANNTIHYLTKKYAIK